MTHASLFSKVPGPDDAPPPRHWAAFARPAARLPSRFIVFSAFSVSACSIKFLLCACLCALLFAARAQSSFQFDASGNQTNVLPAADVMPTIATAPGPQLVTSNNSVTLSIVASGTGLFYQWLSNGVPILGSTGDTLALTNAPAMNSTNFSVIISNSYGAVTSVPVALWVDSRGVGMPDWWQMQYFGNLNQPPDGDYDGDGVSNLDEYLEGTNPTDAASYNPRLHVSAFGGVVAVSPAQPYYTMGQRVSLTAIPDPGLDFVNWDGSISGSANPTTVVMNSHKLAEVVFVATNVITWTNLAGGDWNNARNWSPNQVPGPEANVLITTPGAYTVTVSDEEYVGTLTLGATNGDGTVQTLRVSSGALTVNSDSLGTTQAVVTVSGGTLNCVGALALAGPLNVSGGTANFNGSGTNAVAAINVSSGTLGGTSLVAASGLLNWTGGSISGVVQFNGASFTGSSLYLDGGQLINTGTMDWTGEIATGNGSVIRNLAGATINLAASTSAGTSPGGLGWTAPYTVYNAGQLNVAGTGIAVIGDTLNNSGTVSVKSGALNLAGGGSDSGAFMVAAGAALNLAGGTHVLNSGSVVSGAGNLTVSGGTANWTGGNSMDGVTLNVSGGTASFNGSGTIAPGALNVSGGTLGGTNLVAAGGPLNWTGGYISGVVQFNGGSFTGSSLYLNGGQLINTGTLDWTGEITTGNGSLISNLPGATINLAASTSAGTSPGGLGWPAPYTVYNAGQLNVAGTGKAIIGDTFNNSGTVSVNRGTLSLAGGGSDSGAFTVAAVATLNLAGGTHILNAGSTISGAGNLTMSGGTANWTAGSSMNGITLNVSGGTANFNGDGSIGPAVVNVSGGTLGGTNLVAASGPLNWTGGTIEGVVQFNGGSFTSPSLVLDGGQLINTGTLAWNSEIPTGNGSVISNLAGATINLSANSSNGMFPGTCHSCYGWPGPYTVYNAGQLNAAGTGTAIIADTFNNPGTVSVASGTLALRGSNDLTGGTLNFGINSQTNYGQVSFPGAVALAGALGATLANGFVPPSGSSFTILTYGSETGLFSRTNLPESGWSWQLNYGTTAATLTVAGQLVIEKVVHSGGSVTFTLSTTPGEVYQIQSTTNLNQPVWTALGGSITASNATLSISEPIGADSQQFYRVVLLP